MKILLSILLILVLTSPPIYAESELELSEDIRKSYENNAPEESINVLSESEINKIAQIVNDEKKSINKFRKIIFYIFITIIVALTIVVIQRVFQSLLHRKERERP